MMHMEGDMQWKDIQSAPKDGTGSVVSWVVSDTVHYRIAFYANGDWCVACSDQKCEPTHWMPLPEGP